MGWLLFALLAGLTGLALHASGRCSRQALELCGAALLVAAAGYAWQGSPDLPGQPVGAAQAPANWRQPVEQPAAPGGT